MGDFLARLSGLVIDATERGLEVAEEWGRDALGISSNLAPGNRLPAGVSDGYPAAPASAWAPPASVGGVPMQWIVIGGVAVLAVVLLTRK